MFDGLDSPKAVCESLELCRFFYTCMCVHEGVCVCVRVCLCVCPSVCVISPISLQIILKELENVLFI